MKTAILIIPFLTINAISLNNANGSVIGTGRLPANAVLNISSSEIKKALHGDELMEVMNKMMKDMESQPMKGIVDLDFASMLKIHHQGAINMAKIELQDGKDAKLKTLAQKIIDDQTKEVSDLDKLIASLQSAPKNYDPMKKNSGPAKAMQDDMMSMIKPGHMSMSSVDHEFADMMIKHHTDGIQMAKSIIAYSKTDKLRSMAQKSIPQQSQDIKAFQQWKTNHKG
ncbi:DUF305 domain-containing protein [Mucilaginibacter rubeus]|uniref:DUF305 domain-containing protein n=1 Tax=Mucilaginibacter rubeus TaxID=2027860 RepID=A0AAE6ML03_9SPHI|nr:MULTISPECIES: DUF305 domain-containing protein [Mucilaginibacter]NHA05627.1 DUF305 domain-containing protein [Mucilaginibacter inviolabilis]QEM07054.1 DUF305 domain-containing protein [Mucilaginibacter rubeus]QTE35431.1 DUF305 domain-containing protein [Mucilaginibacter gossypii]QTE50402.1 DUF305 domain-containing protein [Mucilaginibacter rubeus]QTE55489.1 DUF305 domain-containing protein [Mucilaginibacter rubeus]